MDMDQMIVQSRTHEHATFLLPFNFNATFGG